MFHTRIRPADGAVLVLVLLSAILLFILPVLWATPAEKLVISTPAGSSSYPLSQDREIPVSSGAYHLLVVIQNGSVFVSSSTCPDGICRASGEIRRAGESILCAPAGVRLLITAKGGVGDVDFIAG